MQHPDRGAVGRRRGAHYAAVVREITQRGVPARMVARAAGVSDRQVRNWLAGTYKPTGAAPERLVALEYIAGRVDELGLGDLEAVLLSRHPRARGRALVDLLASGEIELAIALVDQRPPSDQPVQQATAGTADPETVAARPARGGLPAGPVSYPDRFVGRARELAEVIELLRKARLITLLGPGGCGKTRLTMQAAAQRRPTYPDGIAVVEVALLREPSMIARALASELGLSDHPVLSPAEVLLRDLAGRVMLVVLDGCEALPAACASLAGAIAAHAPGVQILATSRTRLGSRSERVYSVPALSLPDREHRAADRWPGGDAAALLLDRIGHDRTRQRLTATEAHAVAAICRRCGGLPLAIELAASRAQSIGLASVCEQLDAPAADRRAPAALDDASTDHDDQDAGLQAALDWSYALLDRDERMLLRRLGVCRGGFALGDAERVVAVPDLDVSQTLLALLDKAFVVPDEADRPALRLRMLDPIREYALSRLAEHEETDQVRARHAACFLALARRAEPWLHTRYADRALDALELEHDNLRAALAWAIQTANTEIALRLAGLLWWFWLDRGHLSEGRVWIARALAIEPSPPELRVRALNAAAHLAFWQADYESCHAALEEQLAFAEDLDDARWSHAWMALGRCALETVKGEDLDQAIALSEASNELFRELGVAWEISYALTCGSVAAWFKGDYTRAAHNNSDALAMLRRNGSRSVLAQALWSQSIVVALGGETDQAIIFGEEALTLATEQGNRIHTAYALNVLGSIARYEDDPQRALPLHSQALAIAHEIGELWATLWALDGIASALCAQGRDHLAPRLLAAVERQQRETGHRHPPAERDLHSRDVVAARAHLSADQFAAEWRAGEAMSLEDAVTQALAAS